MIKNRIDKKLKVKNTLLLIILIYSLITTDLFAQNEPITDADRAL